MMLSMLTQHAPSPPQIVRLPMSFFHTTPSGRIVNRFTKDTEALDVQVPSAVQSFLVCSSALLPAC